MNSNFIWNSHPEIPDDFHSTFPASKAFTWSKYTDEKLIQVYDNLGAAQRGTDLHALAAQCIIFGFRMRVEGDNEHKTVAMYVNDCVRLKKSAGDNAQVEQKLKYSWNYAGTTDFIYYDESKKMLKIFDLKTGITPAHFEQLIDYAALFCLEYIVDPFAIDYELRLYQNAEISTYVPEKQEIQEMMLKIVNGEKLIEEHRSER